MLIIKINLKENEIILKIGKGKYIEFLIMEFI